MSAALFYQTLEKSFAIPAKFCWGSDTAANSIPEFPYLVVGIWSRAVVVRRKENNPVTGKLKLEQGFRDSGHGGARKAGAFIDYQRKIAFFYLRRMDSNGSLKWMTLRP